MNDTITVRQHEHLLPHPRAVRKPNRFDYSRKYSIITLALLFFIFCFIGWVWEVSLHIVKDHAFVNRGVQYGPWLPIYGSGAVLILVFLKRFAGNPVLLFFTTVILCGIVEYSTSWYLEKTKGIKWWDYSHQLLNLNGRICAEGLIIFGLGGCLIVYLVAPYFAEKLDRLGIPVKIIAVIILMCVFLTDFLYSRIHPNTGEGITDYDNKTEAANENNTALPSDIVKVCMSKFVNKY